MKISIAMIAVAALTLAACSTPAAPAVGTQIDRFGRPGVNTALTDPFDVSTTVNGSTEDAVKNNYNLDSNSSAWVATYKGQVAFNLAVLDSLDNVCGNQFAAASTLSADRYSALAGVLADDKLYVNTASGSCTTYLGVEANATGIILNTDCGGRTPPEDVIDETYSLLAIGATSGVDDGITNDSTLSTDTFPFLAAPN